MTGKTISGTVTTTVTMGVGGYVSPLRITGNGDIDPAAYGAVGLLLPSSSVAGVIVNSGVIAGGTGSGYQVNAGYGGNGGYAVELHSAFRFTNKGVIAGGTGGGGDYSGGQGGTAVGISAAGIFTNSGQIIGGSGGYGNPKAGAAGYAVVLNAKAALINRGTIRGGNAGPGNHSQYYALPGGTAILANHQDTVRNTGLIVGGESSPSGGSGSYGGTGVELRHSRLINAGTIAGGPGGSRQYAPGGNGGTGVILSDASSGTNTGVILGGNGNHYGNYGSGNGGVGADVQNHSTERNSGSIFGGAGASGTDRGGSGGIGVKLTGGTLFNAGTITGGAGGYGYLDNGANGDAVLLGGDSTLVVENGAVFNGLVVAEVGAGVDADVLQLAGHSSNALTGIGTQIIGFYDIAFAANAAWTIAGDIGGLASGQSIAGFTSNDAIKLTDAAASHGAVSVGTAGVVTISAGGDIYQLDIAGATVGETNFSFSNYTLRESATSPAPAMTFLRPSPQAAAPPPLFTPSGSESFMSLSSFHASLLSGTDTAAWATQPSFTTALSMGAVQEMSKPQQGAVQTLVTLHA